MTHGNNVCIVADNTCRILSLIHILRSPLTSIQGFLTAVIDGTVPPDKQNYYLNIALEESKRLSRLAESMVDMSRADASKLTLDWSDFDLNELIRANIEALQPQLNEKNLIVEAELESHTSLVHGDKDKILRVIHNILENAVKFSPANGAVSYTHLYCQHHKNQIHEVITNK